MSANSRKIRIEAEDSGQDSFLDVVANVVGVLIILVMVVGLQASNGLIQKSNPNNVHESMQSQTRVDAEMIDSLKQELESAAKIALETQAEIEKSAYRLISVQQEVNFNDQQRVELATHRALIEEDIANRRDKLDQQEQRKFDVQRELFESQLKLEKLTNEQLTLASNTDTVEVECVPTPIAKTIEGPAIHIQVRNGLVSVVPFDELIEEAKSYTKGMASRLQNRSRVHDIIGPINGYRLKLTVLDIQSAAAITGPQVGQLKRSQRELIVEFLPNSKKMGLNIEQALLPGADLHRALEENRRERLPIVMWLYNDSFGDSNVLKRKIWEMGYPLAIRPLEIKANIAASTFGEKASAQ